MRHFIKASVLVGLSTWIATCAAQQPGDTGLVAERDGAMNVMRDRLVVLELVGATADDKLPFGQQPILRYNDIPRGISDASVWRLGESGRPRAVLVLEIYSQRSIQYEATAVADPPGHVKGNRWQWSPRKAELIWLEVPTESPPSATAKFRKRQIKQLPQSFSASEGHRGQEYQLRLMPRPLYEYEDRQQGVLEGAVFAWAHGTNVEILMFIEARVIDGNPPRWFAGFSRLSSSSLEVTYDSEVFWRGPQMQRPRPEDAYYFHVESLSADERASLRAQ